MLKRKLLKNIEKLIETYFFARKKPHMHACPNSLTFPWLFFLCLLL